MTLPIEVREGPGWLRPTSPPRFDADAALRSMDLIASVLRGNETLCYSHWGAAGDPLGRVSLARSQLQDWLSAVEAMKGLSPEETLDRLTAQDPLLRAPIEPDLLTRERAFMLNSVRGLQKFLEEREARNDGKGTAIWAY